MCSHKRQLMLVDDDEVNQTIEYTLAYCLQKYDIKLHAIIVEGNHRVDTEVGAPEVPDDLRPLLARLTEGKQPADYLFPANSKTGMYWRDWPRKQVKRICRLAGVKEVTAHVGPLSRL